MPKAYPLQEAQRANAALYRTYANRSPWNSRTRQEWLRLAESAERIAENG